MNHLLTKTILLSAGILAAPLFSIADESAELPSLSDRIEAVLQQPSFQRLSFVGVHVVDTKTNDVLFSQMADKLFTPASNTKIFTSAAALDAFGPDYRFTTTVVPNGELTGTELKGDLVLRAGGDPTLFTDELEALADQVAEKVKTVSGSLVVDVSLFNSPRKGPGWMWDDNPSPYSMSISAIMLNYNTTRIQVRQEGADLIAEFFPPTAYPTISMLGGDGPVTIDRKPFEATFTVTGSQLPEASIVQSTLAVSDPAPWVGNVFYAMLTKRGVEFAPSAEPVQVSQSLIPGEPLATINSKPMSEILSLFNKPSENAIGEMLLHQLSGPTAEKPANWNTGSAALEIWLTETVGVQKGNFRLDDGSGLTRYNLVTPRAITQVLQHMATHPNANTFLASLPIGGVDGTLSGRMQTLPPTTEIHAKTGTMSGVSCLSGYAKNAEGEWKTFSIMINGYVGSSSAARQLQDAICVELVSTPVANLATGNAVSESQP